MLSGLYVCVNCFEGCDDGYRRGKSVLSWKKGPLFSKSFSSHNYEGNKNENSCSRFYKEGEDFHIKVLNFYLSFALLREALNRLQRFPRLRFRFVAVITLNMLTIRS